MITFAINLEIFILHHCVRYHRFGGWVSSIIISYVSQEVICPPVCIKSR